MITSQDTRRGGDDRALSVTASTPAPAEPFPHLAGAGFSEAVYLGVTRLVLLTDAHKARRRHSSTKGIMARLARVTARLAALQ